jgi:hypothetical protein
LRMEERPPTMEEPRTDNKGRSSSLGLTTLHHKNKLVTKNLTEPRTWMDSLDKWPKLGNMDSSPSIIRIIKSRRMRWAGHVARMGEKRNACRLLVGKPEGKRPLGRPRCRWVDNIRMDLGLVGWGDVD